MPQRLDHGLPVLFQRAVEDTVTMLLRLLEEPAPRVKEWHHRADKRKRVPPSELANEPLRVGDGVQNRLPVLVRHAYEEPDHNALYPGVQGTRDPVLHLLHGVGPAAGRRAYLQVVRLRG